MDAAPGTSAAAQATPGGGLAALAPPPLDLAPLTRAELHAWFRGGEPEADACERLLACAARARGALDVAIAEGLHALRRGERLAELAFHLDDYAREVLDLGERSAQALARLGGELRTRPLLREALRSGRVRLRAAETVLPVAKGDAEELWVERAAVQTVRELEEAVRRARVRPEDADEEWLRLCTQLPPPERTVLDIGLEVAGQVMPGSSRMERLEALAQEYLAEFSTDADEDERRRLGPAFRPIPVGRESLRATREAETDRWETLGPLPEWPAPEVRFDDAATAREIDQSLRELARLRRGWDDLIGYCAHAIRRSGLPSLLGFTSFRHYVEERLQLPPRSVEQREALEKRLWESPALREARRQKVSYEKLRILSRLPEGEIGSWIARARAWTCIALSRAVRGEKERQLRAARKLVVPVVRRVAVLLAAAVEAVRERAGRFVPVGTCLAVMAAHLIGVWKDAPNARRSRSQRIRERDGGQCQVPGCSRRGDHAHHVLFRSRGGDDDAANQVATCPFHHLRSIHGGYLRVVGRAPDALRWFRGEEPFTGCA
jgi:hypothetical protein